MPGSEDNKIAVFLAVFRGVRFHWLYEVAVGVYKAPPGTTFTMPDAIWIAARVFISFVVALAGFVAAY